MRFLFIFKVEILSFLCDARLPIASKPRATRSSLTYTKLTKSGIQRVQVQAFIDLYCTYKNN